MVQCLHSIIHHDLGQDIEPYVCRRAMTERCLASGGVRLRRQATVKRVNERKDRGWEWVGGDGELVESAGLAPVSRPPPLLCHLPPMRQTRPRCVTVHRGGSSGEVMPLGAGRVLFHVGAADTVAPVPLATGSWGTLLSGWPLTGAPRSPPSSLVTLVSVLWAKMGPYYLLDLTIF